MELRHLRYFVAVAEELNFTRAAQRLHVAQPALSRQVHDLEEELRTPLLKRGHSGVQLTRAGKAFFTRAKLLLKEADDAVSEAQLAAGVITGKVVLGFPSGLHLNYLQPAIERFLKKHPRVRFDYVQGTPGEQMKLLQGGRLDVAFVTLPEPMAGLQQAVIWRVPFKVVLPRKHPLARKSQFKLSELKDQPFVFCTRESRPEFYDAFLHHCANAGFRPHFAQEVGGYPTNMLALVGLGVGISVLPHFTDAERIRGIVWKRLIEPELYTEFALVWSHDTISSAGAAFVTAARDFKRVR